MLSLINKEYIFKAEFYFDCVLGLEMKLKNPLLIFRLHQRLSTLSSAWCFPNLCLNRANTCFLNTKQKQINMPGKKKRKRKAKKCYVLFLVESIRTVFNLYTIYYGKTLYSFLFSLSYCNAHLKTPRSWYLSNISCIN